MDKSQEASAPSNFQEPPPPYPGPQADQQYPSAGGFQAPQQAGPIPGKPYFNRNIATRHQTIIPVYKVLLL